jgi:hypothetical protein
MCGWQDSELQVGTKETGWDGFKLPLIEVNSGTYLNPATIDLDTLDHLVNDLKSPCAHPQCTDHSPYLETTDQVGFRFVAVLHQQRKCY